MGLIDSHAHLTFPELMCQVDDVLDRAKDAGVDQIITIGTDLADAKRAIELAEQHTGTVFVGAGFHPHEAGKVADEQLTSMTSLWSQPCVVALGEMGLDYHYDFADRSVQRDVFAKQLTLARAFDKPLILHSREAFEDTAMLLVEHGFQNKPAVFHCFTGTASEAEQIAAMGWRISFTGVVTFKKSQWLQEIAKDYLADKIMVETDAPYLSPVPVRNKRPNEPAYVAHTARFLAELRGVSYDEFAEQSAQNTRAFFQLPI